MGDGTGDTDQHPVTTINWRDAMVWCNALTEYHNAQNGTGLECVYYIDSGRTTPIRSCNNSTTITHTSAGSQDAPQVKSGADGFRLPSGEEWELAARYIDDANSDGDGDTESSTDVAVYDANSSSTAKVKSKSANTLGLYDMSGNVWDWCFDWHPSYAGSRRLVHGGGQLDTGAGLQVGSVSYYFPYDGSYDGGFRPVRTP